MITYQRRRALFALLAACSHQVSNEDPGVGGSGGFWMQSRRRQILLLLLMSQNSETASCVRKRKQWNLGPLLAARKKIGAWYTSIPKMQLHQPMKFRNYFRVTPSQFDELVALVEPHIQKRSWSENISPGERFAITLRYLASGDSMISLHYAFVVSQAAISRIIRETCKVLWRVLSATVIPPMSQETWERIANDFQISWNFPNCLGAMDGKHVVVQAFAKCGSAFYNYKQSHSVVLLALADANYQFIMVDIGARGRRSDGGIFSSSEFGKCLESNSLDIPPPKCLPGTDVSVPYVIVADEAFPLQEHIMRPFPGEFLSDEKIVFNYRLSRARRIVENTFGIWSARWWIFRRPILASEETVKAVISACVVLHNWIMQRESNMRPHRRQYNPPRFTDFCNPDGSLVPGRWRSGTAQGAALQDMPAHYRWGGKKYNRIRQTGAKCICGLFHGARSSKLAVEQVTTERRRCVRCSIVHIGVLCDSSIISMCSSQ